MKKIIILLFGVSYLLAQDLDFNLENQTDSLKIEAEIPLLVPSSENSNELEEPENVDQPLEIDIQINQEEDDNGNQTIEVEATELDNNSGDFNIDININENSEGMSGLTYFDFTYSDDKGIFDIKRSYFTYDQELSEKYYFKMVFDVGRDILGTDTDQRLSVYLKNAQLTIKLKEKSLLYFGLIGMNMFNVQEKTWGYRYINKSAMDEYGFSASADLGFGYKLKLKNFTLSTLLTNGEGYKSLGTDEFQKLSVQFLCGDSNLSSVQSGNAFNVGLVLSIEPFESQYLTDSNGSNLTDDGDNGYIDLLETTFEGMRSIIGLFGGFTMQTFMGGLEYNMFNSFDNENFSIENGTDQSPFGDDDVLSSQSTYGDMKTSSLISTYFSFGLTPKFNMFLRADIYDSNIASDVIDDSETHLLLGFHFPISEYMDLAPVIKYNTLEAVEDATIDFGLNFQFKF